MTQHKIYLVGAGIEGWEGFGNTALSVIDKTKVMIGRQRHLDIFPAYPGQKMVLGPLPELLDFLKETDQPVAILASGDPNFFGISRFLLRNLPKERISIFANVTSMQYAFARIKEPWDDAIFVSAQDRGMHAAVDRILSSEKACVLTDSVNTPTAIAREMIERGAEGYEAWLCEDLGLDAEKFTRTSLRGLLEQTASDLNLLILIKIYEPNLVRYPLIGVSDDEFLAVQKPVTPQETRAVIISKLRVQDGLVMWDIGSGSCSVSIEVSNLMPNGRIFVLGDDPSCAGIIRENLKKFCARNVKLIETYTPEGVDDLPDPDRVFVSGGAGQLEEIIELADNRLTPDGLIVINATTLDALNMAMECLGSQGYETEITCVNISRTSALTEYKLLEAQNPVYIITARK